MNGVLRVFWGFPPLLTAYIAGFVWECLQEGWKGGRDDARRYL